MLKKIFTAVMTLALLGCSYVFYIQVFAILVKQLKVIKHTDNFAFPIHDSKSLQASIRYVVEACGAEHWAADKDLPYRYYNAERGYWIYAKECIRVVVEDGVRYDGKRMRMKPFLLITKSRDGKNTKIITADRAVFDLNSSLGFDSNSGREPLKIKHAHLEPNVCVRDDKATPNNLADDTKIGPLTTLDYEESTQQITTELDTHVVMQDPDGTVTANGMIMQLRRTIPSDVTSSSTGFEGLERLELLKDVHVIINDVGKAGLFPGSGSSQATVKKSQASSSIEIATDGKPALSSQTATPTPLDLKCDAKMQIFVPKPKSPVSVGPPVPPAPTLAQFERNVVVLRGDSGTPRDQLTCDTLKLTLIPADGISQQQPLNSRLNLDSSQPIDSTAKSEFRSNSPEQLTPNGNNNQGLLGNLTLQRAHATGHAVWLILPTNGIKLRCNEMIHVRQLPVKSDQTYFRGDGTRSVEIVKVDIQPAKDQQKSNQPEKVTAVTNIWTVDLTLFDSGIGMDAADVVAHGPGRLETRSNHNQPVEQIAIWQDKLVLVNTLGSRQELLYKKIDLTGNRPCFIDCIQKTSLDSAAWIQVLLRPKTVSSAMAQGDSKPTTTSQQTTRTQNDDGSVIGALSSRLLTEATNNNTAKSESLPKTATNTGVGGLELEELHALTDVHLNAPAKLMIARSRLDAQFVQAEALSPPSNTATNSRNERKETFSSEKTPVDPQPGKNDEGNNRGLVHNDGQVQTDEPTMNGTCDRIWAKIAVAANSHSRDNAFDSTPARTASLESPKTRSSNAEIRNLWMYGNVAIHQEPKKDQIGEVKSVDRTNQKMDATGEALYLENRGTNKVITYVYQRDPTERTPLPGPLPPAHVMKADRDDQKAISGAGVIQINQATDQFWVSGPGTLTQLTDRGFLTDKAPNANHQIESSTSNGTFDNQVNLHADQVKIASTSTAGRPNTETKATSESKSIGTKPKTRAGLSLGPKVPMTIGFSENMEFIGRSTDPEGHSAAQANFFGVVIAEMEDAMLYCADKMITFTDREIPLARRAKTTPKSPESTDNLPIVEDTEAEQSAELTLLFCYRNAGGISRKVDPELPIPIQQQRIEAAEILAYDRRTGDFYVKGKGKVFLYDRDAKASPNNTQHNTNKNQDTRLDTTDSESSSTPYRVTQTSTRLVKPTGARTGNLLPPSLRNQHPSEDVEPSELPTMILTQIQFNRGMIGRFASGQQNDRTDDRWSEFFGDVEACRAKVINTKVRLNADHLPVDGLFLTGQTLQVLQEPPPLGAPEATTARQYLKATEKAYAWNHEKALNADVITYDSYKDLVYAYGKDGHNVVIAEQHAAGQPISSTSAENAQLNPKTGAVHLSNPSSVGLIDKNTGYRPAAAAPDDPYTKKKKPPKRPFRLPTQNIERRGWTGT